MACGALCADNFSIFHDEFTVQREPGTIPFLTQRTQQQMIAKYPISGDVNVQSMPALAWCFLLIFKVRCLNITIQKARILHTNHISTVTVAAILHMQCTFTTQLYCFLYPNTPQFTLVYAQNLKVSFDYAKTQRWQLYIQKIHYGCNKRLFMLTIVHTLYIESTHIYKYISSNFEYIYENLQSADYI